MKKILFLCFWLLPIALLLAQKSEPKFKVLSFYTAQNDRAHISFVHEANRWFAAKAKEYHFAYDSTNNWNLLNLPNLANYQVVVFLDTRPEAPELRTALQTYLENGGSWLGFHFAAFALTPSKYPQDWDWYHQTFLGAGEYRSNTWRPTSAILHKEGKHPVLKGLPTTFKTAPNEWYRWKNDLRQNPDIQVLFSIDPISFPLGTGPKPHEIWHSGDYPVVWTNKNYHMLYLNMGHNDIDYEGGTNQELSFQFGNKWQDKLVLNALMWLGKKPKSN